MAAGPPNKRFHGEHRHDHRPAQRRRHRDRCRRRYRPRDREGHARGRSDGYRHRSEGRSRSGRRGPLSSARCHQRGRLARRGSPGAREIRAAGRSGEQRRLFDRDQVRGNAARRFPPRQRGQRGFGDHRHASHAGSAQGGREGPQGGGVGDQLLQRRRHQRCRVQCSLLHQQGRDPDVDQVPGRGIRGARL